MSNTKDSPTSLQLAIVEAWAAGMSAKATAEELECSIHTVHEVKKNKDLKQLYYEKQHDKIVELVPLAIKRLRDILGDSDTQASVTIAAVKEILDRSHIDKLYENLSADKELKISIEYVDRKAADNGDGTV